VRAAFAGCPALALTTVRLRAYVAERLAADAAPATINGELGLVRRMLRLAYRDGRLPSVPMVPMLHVENARTGFLEPADFEALVAALPAHLQPPTRCAYLTGWRRAEILGLTWDRVSLDADGGGTIRLDATHTKTRAGRVFAFAAGSPLAELLAVQADARRLDCAHVFHRNGRPLRYFYDAWRKACAAVGQPRLLFHDLRRSAVRNMIRAGVPERVCMARSGHKTRSMLDRYNIVSEDDLRAADEKVAAYLAARVRAENGHSGRKVVAIDEERLRATC
jgi:integrase